MHIQQITDNLVKLEGAIYCVLVDADNGSLLARSGGEGWPLLILADKSAEIVRADRQSMQVLGKKEEAAKELLFTDTEYLHAIIILPQNPRFYICIGLHRKQGNLVLVRRILQETVANWVIDI